MLSSFKSKIRNVHCVTDYYSHLLFCCKPGLSSKFRPILGTQVALADFQGDEAKKFQKKFQNGRFSKLPFFKIANSQIFFVKISWIGPWVSRID
jgi:hypothetical protein